MSKGSDDKSLEISWAGIVAVFILWQSLVSFVDNCYIVYFG